MRAIVQDQYGTDPRVLDSRRSPGRRSATTRSSCACGGQRRHGHVAHHDRPAVPDAPRRVRRPRGPKAPNPGRSLAGTVEAVGKDVTGFAPGDEVYGSGDGVLRRVRPRRDRTSSRQAGEPLVRAGRGGARSPALTALQAVRDKAKVQPGQQVLIIGASGGVGTFAVQIAKAFGADVTGVCSTAKVDLVRSLGADHVIDYTARRLRRRRARYDVILDIGGNRRLARLRRALAAARDARHRRRRDRWALARWLRPLARGAAVSLFVARSSACSPRRRTRRTWTCSASSSSPAGHAGDRPHLSAQRDGGGDPLRARRRSAGARSSSRCDLRCSCA